MTRALRLAAVALAGVLALAGCGFKGAYSLPLPGGNAHGPTYKVTAVFDDVQDLVPMSAVRVNDVAVGDVTDITYDPKDHKAHVAMRINKSVHLPANAVATLEQTTLLGEKFVALGAPDGQPPVGTLQDGALLQDDATSNLPDVEEVFAVLSQVLNGGDLQDLQTINLEISKALGGRERAVRSALKQLDVFVRGLDSQKQQIVRALDELNRFSGALASQTGTIATALDELGPGLKVLADERVQFTQMLTDLARFGDVASHIIRASRVQTVAGLRDLQPILQHLRAAGTNLPRSLELLITYPFPRAIDKAIPGDYNGLRLSFNADPIFCTLFPPPVPSACQGLAGAFSSPAGSAGHHVRKKPGSNDNGGGPTNPLPVPVPTQTPTLPPLPGLPTPTPSSTPLCDLLGCGLLGGTP